MGGRSRPGKRRSPCAHPANRRTVCLAARPPSGTGHRCCRRDECLGSGSDPDSCMSFVNSRALNTRTITAPPAGTGNRFWKRFGCLHFALGRQFGRAIFSTRTLRLAGGFNASQIWVEVTSFCCFPFRGWGRISSMATIVNNATASPPANRAVAFTSIQ